MVNYSENDANNKKHIRRSSSSSYSGPDDDTIEVLDKDTDKEVDNNKDQTEDKSTATEVSKKAIESAKYFGSNQQLFYWICIQLMIC